MEKNKSYVSDDHKEDEKNVDQAGAKEHDEKQELQHSKETELEGNVEDENRYVNEIDRKEEMEYDEETEEPEDIGDCEHDKKVCDSHRVPGLDWLTPY